VSRLARLTAIALVVILGANIALAAKELRGGVRPTWNDDRVLTILIIGSDMGLPRPGSPLRGRADAIHIVAVDTKRKEATIVDIPRDSYIGGDKVNAHLSRGGPKRLKDVLTRYTGVKLDKYILTSFRGLRAMVSGMGGVKLRLDRPIRDSASRASLRAGTQRLDGEEALAFSRARKTVPGGDFGRTRHQGVLIRAAHQNLRDRKLDLLAMTRLLGVFSRNTATDIGKADLFRMATLAMSIAPGKIKQVPLSGPTGFAGAQSIVNLRAGSAFTDIRKGRIGR
jgi:polyisoprenyl-teichoic acid--peptidoglycan teichoic acid transferase